MRKVATTCEDNCYICKDISIKHHVTLNTYPSVQLGKQAVRTQLTDEMMITSRSRMWLLVSTLLSVVQGGKLSCILLFSMSIRCECIITTAYGI